MRMGRWRWFGFLGAVLGAAVSSGAGRSAAVWEEVQMDWKLTSTAFQNQGPIPPRYTCEGEDVSPPLEWTPPPAGTRSLVLIVDDPDAPDPRAPKVVWVHWVVYNLPPQTAALPEAAKSEDFPAGTAQGLNDWKRIGYGGPCPPIGRHRYFFKLYALDSPLTGLKDPNKSAVLNAMEGHVLAQTELVGTYQKTR